jgi:hypothetical protein
MLTKLEFLLEDLTAEEATDDVLSAFLQEHPEQFRIQPQLSFQQVYINADKHQDPESHAEKLLESLNTGASSESLGDHSMLPGEFEMATQTEIAYSFGERFAEDIVLQEPGGWRGPVYSPYGVHLLKISERIEARLPALAEIRYIVEREYQVQHSKEQKDLVYKMLRESYDISIEPLAAEVVPTDKTLAAIQVSQQK